MVRFRPAQLTPNLSESNRQHTGHHHSRRTLSSHGVRVMAFPGPTRGNRLWFRPDATFQASPGNAPNLLFSAPTGRSKEAQGNALGTRPRGSEALKGRPNGHANGTDDHGLIARIRPPFQGSEILTC